MSNFAQPIVGTNATIELTLVVAGTPVGSTIFVKNSDWSIKPTNGVAEGPNTTDGMLRTPGLFDYSGDFKGSVDATSATTAIESQIKSGNIYQAKLYRSKGSSLFYQATIIIGDIAVATGTATVENYTVSFMKQSGLLTFPDGSTQ